MLTYATLDDFKLVKQVRDLNSITHGIPQELLDASNEKMKDYLIRATRYVNRFTRREFFPWRQTRSFAIPHAFNDLQMRRFLTANLYMDADLLEVKDLTNGDQSLTELDDFFYDVPNIYPIQSIELKFPNYWGGQYGQSLYSFNFNEPIIDVDGIWGYHDGYSRIDEAWVDTEDAVQDAPLSALATTITVGDVDGKDRNYLTRFNVGNLIKIEDEFIEIVEADTDANTLTVIRGIRGTTSASHVQDTPIYRWRVIEDIVEATLKIAKVWRESDTSIGGRMGVSDMSAGIEMGVPADPQNIIRAYQRSYIGR